MSCVWISYIDTPQVRYAFKLSSQPFFFHPNLQMYLILQSNTSCQFTLNWIIVVNITSYFISNRPQSSIVDVKLYRIHYIFCGEHYMMTLLRSTAVAAVSSILCRKSIHISKYTYCSVFQRHKIYKNTLRYKNFLASTQLDAFMYAAR